MTSQKTAMPWSAQVMFVLAALCTGLAVLNFAGMGGSVHPLLASDGAGLALLVSAVALLGSGMFPLVLARLRQGEEAGGSDE